MQTRSMTARRWLLLAAQLCVLATPLVLGGCDTYTDRFGVEHVGSFDAMQALADEDRIAAEKAEKAAQAESARQDAQAARQAQLDEARDSTLFDWTSVNASSGPNIQGLATSLGIAAGAGGLPSSPPCLPPCGVIVLPP